jgi:hypothetical protein
VLIPLFPEIVITDPWLEELSVSKGVTVRVVESGFFKPGASSGLRVTVHFSAFVTRLLEELCVLDHELLLNERVDRHWIYEATESELLRRFRELNPRLLELWNFRHYLVVTHDESLDIISTKAAEVSCEPRKLDNA